MWCIFRHMTTKRRGVNRRYLHCRCDSLTPLMVWKILSIPTCWTRPEGPVLPASRKMPMQSPRSGQASSPGPISCSSPSAVFNMYTSPSGCKEVHSRSNTISGGTKLTSECGAVREGQCAGGSARGAVRARGGEGQQRGAHVQDDPVPDKYRDLRRQKLAEERVGPID